MERRMPLSRAEIQKRYREKKKKKESGNYVKKERERKRKAYVPDALLNESAAKTRRTDTLVRVKLHNGKKRNQQKQILNSETIQTRQMDVNQSDMNSLTVKLNFEKKRRFKIGNFTKKLMKTNKDVLDLTKENSKLLKEKRRLQKQLQRSKKKDKESGYTKQSATEHDDSSSTATDDEATEDEVASSVTAESDSSLDENVLKDKRDDIQNNASTSLNMKQIGTSTKQVVQNECEQNDLTPRSKANKVLIESELSPRQHKKLEEDY